MAAGQVGIESSGGVGRLDGWRWKGWKIWGQGGVNEMELGRGRLPVRLPLSLMGNWFQHRLRAHKRRRGNQNNVGKGSKAEGERV